MQFLYRGEVVKNMSMKSVLLSAFGVMLIALALVYGLSFMALGNSAEGIAEIERSNALIAKVTTTEKYILQGVTFATLYVQTQEAEDLQRYQEISDKAMKWIDQLGVEMAESDESELIKQIHAKLNKYDTLLRDGGGVT